MDIPTYNKYSILFQFINNSSRLNLNSYFDDYWCFNKEILIFKERMDILSVFENKSVESFYSDEHFKNNPLYYSEKYHKKKMVKFNEIQICFHNDFIRIFLHIIIFKLKENLKNFVEFIENFQSNHFGYAKLEKDAYTYKIIIHIENYNKILENFYELNQTNKLIIHFLVNSGLTVLPLINNYVEIDLKKINSLLENLKEFNLKKFQEI